MIHYICISLYYKIHVSILYCTYLHAFYIKHIIRLDCYYCYYYIINFSIFYYAYLPIKLYKSAYCL